MAFTYKSVIDLARMPLNDDDKARYSDIALLIYANHGILQILKRRPDLFIGQFDNLPAGNAALDDAFPLAPWYVQTLADYITARAEMTDDEHVNSGRAAAFVQLFATEAQP